MLLYDFILKKTKTVFTHVKVFQAYINMIKPTLWWYIYYYYSYIIIIDMNSIILIIIIIIMLI